MRIENTNAAIRPSTENLLTGSAALRELEIAAPSGSKPLESFAPTSDLEKLLQKLRTLPEVREDVVYEVKFRILTGELDGPDASSDVAAELG